MPTQAKRPLLHGIRALDPGYLCRRSRRVALPRLQRTGEGGFDRAKYKIVNETRVSETNLQFGRMRIYVDASRIELQKYDIGRLSRLKKHVLISQTHGVAQYFVAYDATVNKCVLHIRLWTRKCRISEPAVQPQSFDLPFKISCMLKKVLAAHLTDSCFVLFAARRRW